MMFTHENGSPVLLLDEEQCWKLLHHSQHGRLAVSVGNDVDIVPTNYAALDGKIYLRSGAGDKLSELTVNPRVAFETDGILSDEAWSVVVHGKARVLEHDDEIETARRSGLNPWVPTLKDFWVVIEPERITGRHFVFGHQPEQLDEF